MTHARLSLAALLLLAGCGKPPPPAFERPPSPVQVAAAVTREAPRYLDEIGRCVARELVTIRPQVSGRLVAVHVADGADVKAGAPLFSIDSRAYRARLDAAQAGLGQAEAARDLAKLEYDRAAGLAESMAVSKQDVEARKSAVEVTKARVEESRAAVDAAKLDLEYCEIASPIDGRAGHRLADVGNIVGPGSALLVLQRLDPIYADFSVTENSLSDVQRNLARGALKVEVRLPDEGDRPCAGELTFVDNAVQEGTGRVKLRATVPNAERRLWPGRFVRVRLVLETLPAAVLVPATAAQLSARGPYVYVVKEDGTAELRPVVLGQHQGELVVVDRGVQAGERVITNGHIGVMPGGKVRVVDPAAAPGAKP